MSDIPSLLWTLAKDVKGFLSQHAAELRHECVENSLPLPNEPFWGNLDWEYMALPHNGGPNLNEWDMGFNHPEYPQFLVSLYFEHDRLTSLIIE